MATADRVLQLKLIADVASVGKDMKKAEGRLKSMGKSAVKWGKAFTGALAIDAVIAFSDAIGQGITDFRAGEDAAENLSQSWARLGKDGTSLAKTIAKISDTAVGLGFDDTESVKTFDAFLQRTKDSGKAMKLLAAAQDIARSENIDLASAMRIVEGLYNGSARATRRYGIEGTKGMNAVNLALRGNRQAAEKWAKNHPIEVLSGKVGEFFEAIAGAIVVPGLDAFVIWLDATFTPAMDDAVGKVEDLQAALSKVGLDIELPDISGAMAGFMAPFTEGLGRIGTTFDTITAAVTGDWQTFLDNLVSMATTTLLGPLLLPFQMGWGLIKAGFDALGIDIEDIIGDTFDNVVGIIKGLTDDVFTAARGFGQKIYDALLFWMNAAVDVVKNLINSVIDGLNSINDFSWPRQGFEINTPLGSAFVGFDAGSLHLWDDIPHLGSGGIVNSPTMALLGESGREAVVPLDRGGFGNTTFNITVQGALVDPVGAGKAVVAAIKAYEASSGALWRKGSGATRTRYG